MGIKFEYINYDEKIYDYIEKKDEFCSEDNLFIFIDNRMKEIFTRKIGGKLFSNNPTFLTMDEFKERIFTTDKVVLKEAKRILAFFKSLPDDVKRELEITNYFDIIDFANNFFAYYRELNISCNKEIEPYKWQENYLKYFIEIKKSFDRFAKENGYIPSDWLESMEYFNPTWVNRFKNIIFVDIVEFPKVYKKVIYELGKNHDVILLLQMGKDDFDEKELKLGDVKVPKIKENLSVYRFSDDLQEAISLIKLHDEKGVNIYSPAVEQNNFYQIFPNNFAPSRRDVMNDTRIFKFLNIQLNLLAAKEEKLKGTYLLSEMVDAFQDRTFAEYYDITKEDFIKLNNLLKDGFKYISKKVLEDEFLDEDWKFVSIVETILYDLNEISTIKDVDSLYDYFQNLLNMEKLFEKEKDYDNRDIIEKIMEIFGMMKVNENIGIYGTNREIFGSRVGEGIYRLLLQYMKDIVIKSTVKVPIGIPLIKPLDFIKYAVTSNDSLNCFIDITDEFIPKIVKDKLIFTESQRKELGMISGDEKRDIERYRFFQAVCCATNPVIFTKKDEDAGIGVSPFLEEIINTNSIEMKDIDVSLESVDKILENIFAGDGINCRCENNLDKESRTEEVSVENEEGVENKNSDEASEDKKREFIIKSVDDFKDRKINLGAYDIGTLMECPAMFYFSKMRELEPIEKGEDKDLDPRILGIIVHRVLERVVKEMWKDVLHGNLDVDIENIKRKLDFEFDRARYMIQVHMDNYIRQILIPLLGNNIYRFFEIIKKKYGNRKITRFQGEKSKFEERPYYSGNIDVNLIGRADLVIETDNGNTVIDYKTGNGSAEQLDYYNIILYDDDPTTKKVIFNVWKCEYQEFDKPKLKKEDVDAVVKNLSDSEFYAMSEKASKCKSCIYNRLCRRDG